jgi:hypothetical protein
MEGTKMTIPQYGGITLTIKTFGEEPPTDEETLAVIEAAEAERFSQEASELFLRLMAETKVEMETTK